MSAQRQPRRIYISGPITGIPDGNLAAFAHAARTIAQSGEIPVNPHENGLPPTASWREHMRADLRMLADCDAILLLPGWGRSRGAYIEQKVAQILGMQILLSLPIVDSMTGA
jgi:hypothetical protein